MGDSISIRKAKPEDFNVIFQFVCALQNREFNYHQLKELYYQNLNNTDNIYLIAELNKQAAGYASYHLQSLLHHGGKVAEIQEMFVLPEYRSLGIGKILMNTIKSEVNEKGAIQLEVTTRIIREQAIQFYIREQFEDSHKKLVYYFKPIS